MKKYLALFIIIGTLSFEARHAKAQDNAVTGDSVRRDLLYSMSGFGFAFPLGQTSDYFKARFSTDLGLNIGLGKKGGLFLYPKISLQAYRYDEIYPETGFSTKIENGRATTYLGNLMLGYRFTSGHVAFYGFAGGGGGLILTPQVMVSNGASAATLSNRSNWMGTVEGGAGMEYSLGDAVLFVEGSYLRGFTKIQDRTFQSAPVYVGIKPNLTKLLLKLTKRKS